MTKFYYKLVQETKFYYKWEQEIKFILSVYIHKPDRRLDDQAYQKP